MNERVLNLLNSEEVTVVIQLADEAEVDEMWSYVGQKREQRWLWHAVDHCSGKVLAYVFGRRQDEVFSNSKRYSSRLASRRITRTIGVLIHAISKPMSPSQANGIHRK